MKKLHAIWLQFIDNSIVPFLRSKSGMYIILGIIIWIILY